MAAPYTVNNVASVFRRGLFNGKVAVVTGGGTGIGRTITQELLYLGCKVMIAARNVERLKKAVENFYIPEGSGASVACFKCNIRRENEVKELISGTISKFGKLDFLVNNSGGQFRGPTSELSHKGWNAVIDLNLTGTFLMSREAYNQWMTDHGGSIVNILFGFTRGRPQISHSSAARAAVDNLTKSLAVEWAHTGVRINSVAPSSVLTENAVALYGKDAFARKVPGIPAKRLCSVEEVSAAVIYLLGPAAAYISGSTLKVDGGLGLYSFKDFEVPGKAILGYYGSIDFYKKRGESQSGSYGIDNLIFHKDSNFRKVVKNKSTKETNDENENDKKIERKPNRQFYDST